MHLKQMALFSGRNSWLSSLNACTYKLCTLYLRTPTQLNILGVDVDQVTPLPPFLINLKMLGKEVLLV